MINILLSHWRYIAILGAIIALWYYGYTCGADSVKKQWEAEITQAKEQAAIIERKAIEVQNENELLILSTNAAIDDYYDSLQAKNGSGKSTTSTAISKNANVKCRDAAALQRTYDKDSIARIEYLVQQRLDRKTCNANKRN